MRGAESESPHDLSWTQPLFWVHSHFAPIEHYPSQLETTVQTRPGWKLIIIFYLGINLLLKFDRHMISVVFHSWWLRPILRVYKGLMEMITCDNTASVVMHDHVEMGATCSPVDRSLAAILKRSHLKNIIITFDSLIKCNSTCAAYEHNLS